MSLSFVGADWNVRGTVTEGALSVWNRAFCGDCAARPPGVSFRPIEAGDRAFLLELYSQTRLDELSILPWPDVFKRQFLDQQFAAQHGYYHDVFSGADFLLVLREERSIGRIYVHRTEREICILDIALVPSERNRRLGTALLEEVIEEAQRKGQRVALHVEAHNPARRLYERLGFVPVAKGSVYDLLHLTPKGACVS